MVSRRGVVALACVGVALGLVAPRLWSDEPPQAEKHKLAFKFRPNQVLRYEVINDTEITTTAREETVIQRNSTTTKRHDRVAAVDETTGAADLELSIDWVYMRAAWDNRDGTPPIPIEFQSDDPEKQPKQFKDILATVGKPRATIRFKPSGQPVKVVSTRVPAASGRGLPSETGGDGALEAHLMVLPEHPVAVGDSWTEKFDTVTVDEHRNLTKLTLQRIYKLADVKAGRATIEHKTVILTPVTNPAIAARMILTEVAGKILFDIEKGSIVSKEWTAENTVVNPIPGVSSQMKAKGRYSEKLVADDPASERTAAGGAGATSKK